MQRPPMIGGFDKPSLGLACHRIKRLALMACRKKSTPRRRPLRIGRSVVQLKSRKPDAETWSSSRMQKKTCRGGTSLAYSQTADPLSSNSTNRKNPNQEEVRVIGNSSD